VLNQSVVHMDLELSPKERSVFLVFAIQGYIFYIKSLYSKYCLLILPLFVAICETLTF